MDELSFQPEQNNNQAKFVLPLFFVLALVITISYILFSQGIFKRDKFVAPPELPLEYSSPYGFVINHNKDWTLTEQEPFSLILEKEKVAITITNVQLEEKLDLKDLLQERIDELTSKEGITAQINDTLVEINDNQFMTADITFPKDIQEETSQNSAMRVLASIYQEDKYVVVTITYDSQDQLTEALKLVDTLRFEEMEE